VSDYPPGFGSASDLDHVYGPLSEEDLNTECPECDQVALVRLTWRSGGAQVICAECGYEKEEIE
jgi:hypothetical protein